MAFLRSNMTITRQNFNAIPGPVAPTMHFYANTADTAATIIAAGYFNSVADSLIIGDAIYFYPSDNANVGFAVVNEISPNVTVVVFL